MSWEMISWRCIFAGVVAALAVSIILATLGVALGFTVVDPTSNSPFSGLGTTVGIWSVVSIVVSLAVGGFVAGLFSGVRGPEHGFMVWSTVLIAATLFGGVALGSAVRSVGSMIWGVGSGAATVAAGIGQGAGNLAASAVDGLRDGVNLNVDTDEIRGEVASVLRDTGVEELQPEYLANQMREARGDLRGALGRMAVDGATFSQAGDEFIEKQKQRAENITREVDRDSAVAALMRNRDMSRQDAEQAVDGALAVYARAADGAKRALAEAEDRIVDARNHVQSMIAQARVKADEFASAAARSALFAAVALVLGAVICCYAGLYGSRLTGRHSILIEERRGVEIPITRPVDSRL